MTREEVKKYLMNMHGAINALEKELCEDISEDGTLTVNVEDGTKVSRVFVCGDNHFGGLYYPDEALSSSEKPKIGHWIKHSTGHSIYYDCSLCGCLASYTEIADKKIWKLSNYCPDCGAKMQEVEE